MNKQIQVSEEMVEHWVGDEDVISFLTDLINETWRHGFSGGGMGERLPTMQELRDDIAELWQSR